MARIDQAGVGGGGGRIGRMLSTSARAVRDAVEGRVETGRGMDRHYDHPILLLQHLLWHEGYHHGQIKLARMAAGSSGLAARPRGRPARSSRTERSPRRR